MKIFVVAVRGRNPRWVNEAFDEYAKRMPGTARIKLFEIRAEPRDSGKPPAALLEAEARRIGKAVPPGMGIVALDERGREFSTASFARWLGHRVDEGRDAAFVIGGADGLAPGLKEGAELLMRLSSMTLPHGLARVLLAEQLYRAASIMQGHPYHRD